MKKIHICPICSSLNTQFRFTGSDILYHMVKKIFYLYECKDCNALYLNPIPSTKEASNFYPKTYYSYEINSNTNFFSRIKKNIIKYSMEPLSKFTLLDKLLIIIFKNKFSGVPLYRKKDGYFLDIGCGNGSNLEILQKYGWQTEGIELDKKAVEYARKKGLNARAISFEKANFGNKKFDCIRIWHVFEHLTNPHYALKKMKSLLTKDGEILMAVPNYNSIASYLFGKYWYGLDVPRHIISYSPKTLILLLKKHNLIIKKIQFASAGAFVGSFSNFLRKKINYKGNLINNVLFVIISAPFDFISDLLKKGDTIFLTIKKNKLS